VPDPADLFPNGEPPTDHDLRRYLTQVKKVPRSTAERIVSMYQRDIQVRGEDAWTPDRLEAWVDAQIESQTQDAPLGQNLAQTLAERFGNNGDGGVSSAVNAADEAVGRASRTRDRFYKAADMFFDSGPAMDPNALAQSLAVGVFTDAAGNPKIDPNTGAPMEVNAQTLWGAIKGQTFDMGTLSFPRAGRDPRKGARAGREGADDARLSRLGQVSSERRKFVTPSMAMALLGSMDEDYLTHLQQQLWEAGLFGDQPPSWGHADETTRKAYMALFAEASLTPNEAIDRVLSRLTDEAVTRGTAGGADGTAAQVPGFKPEIASKETLGQMIDDIAGDLLGRFATDEEKNSLISKLQQREIDNQRQQYDRDVNEATSGATGGAGGGGGIDAFMAAIATQESGGNYDARNAGSGASGKYQIMPANWGPWAEQAGIGRNAPRTPENQELVARHVMMQYYQRFGNWRDVAIAWFAGPGAVGTPGAESRSDGNMTVQAYADAAMDRMAAGGGAAAAAGGGGYAPIETFDPAAEAEAALKAADPIGWEGHQFASRATEFYSLLGGLT
jgi:hypothetical protein